MDTGRTTEMKRIDWVRATFAGAVGGGVLWAVVVRLLALGSGHVSMAVRAAWVLGGVCGLLLLLGVLLFRFAAGNLGRTYAVAMLIAPCLGLGLLLVLLVLGGTQDLIGA